MKLPLPCNFGEFSRCENRLLPLCGVSWYNWSSGMDYTYFFNTESKWNPVTFYNTKDPIKNVIVDIPDHLLEEGFIKEKGFPLKGRGYIAGLDYINGKTFVDIISTTNYLAHIRVQCDEKICYVPNGEIRFPTSWETDEKKQRMLLKSAMTNKEKINVNYEQFTIFDFLTR